MRKLSPLQEHLLAIYKDFQETCERNNLRYYVAAGTAIGAVRHHGFIPWDDDMDIIMPISDFNKFKKIHANILPKHLSFRESYWMGGKIHDDRTTVIDIRFLSRPESYHGVYLDIFPLVGTPNDEAAREKFLSEIKTFQTNAELLEFYPEISPFSSKEILKWKNYLQTAYSFDTSTELAALCLFLCDGDGIRNATKVKFEDTTAPISANYDKDLTRHFGDYMTLPPKTERKVHDKYHLIDLDTPFSYYAKKYKESQQWIVELISKSHQIEGELTQFANSLQYILKEKESEIKKLQEQNEEARNEIATIRQSNSYKIGNSLARPFRFLKERLNGK